MKKIKAVIFDVDGVIFDTERMSSRFWIATMKKYGHKMTDETYKKVMGRNFDGVIDGLEKIYNDPDIDFRSIAVEKREAMINELDSNRIPVLPGVFEIFEYLKEKGYKIGIATSTGRNLAEKRLKKENIYAYIDEFMFGDEVENSKPNPEIFLKVASKLNLRPEECLVLEDSPSGIKAAFSGGFKCINVVDFKEPTKEMINQSDGICNNLFEVIDWLEKNNNIL